METALATRSPFGRVVAEVFLALCTTGDPKMVYWPGSRKRLIRPNAGGMQMGVSKMGVCPWGYFCVSVVYFWHVFYSYF